LRTLSPDQPVNLFASISFLSIIGKAAKDRNVCFRAFRQKEHIRTHRRETVFRDGILKIVLSPGPSSGSHSPLACGHTPSPKSSAPFCRQSYRVGRPSADGSGLSRHSGRLHCGQEILYTPSNTVCPFKKAHRVDTYYGGHGNSAEAQQAPRCPP